MPSTSHHCQTPEDPEKPWYSAVPIGWNKLDRMVKDIFAEANISGKTNHSLRATGATRMYNHGIPEKTIQVRTGHKSIDGLRVYERPGLEQHREACEALADVTNKQVLPKSSGLDVSYQNIVAPTVHILLFLLFNLQILVHLYCLQVSHSVAVQ